MLVDVVCTLLSSVALRWSAVTRPTTAMCPAGWYLNGVRPSGQYECRRAPVGDPLYDGAGGYSDRTVDRPGWLVGQVWCKRGVRPIVVDERTVGCQR